MQSEVSDFLRYCRLERRLAALTCSAYERDVSACMRFLRAEGFSEWRRGAAARPAQLPRHEAERGRPVEPGPERRGAEGLLPLLLENEYLERDPALVLRTPKKREALPDCSTGASSHGCSGPSSTTDVWQRHFPGKRERDRLLLALFAFAAFAASELLGLDWDDIDLDRRLLRIRKAKGGRQRVVPLHPALAPLFIDYLRVRAPTRSRRSLSACKAGGCRRRS